jgi:hypothetical protein
MVKDLEMFIAGDDDDLEALFKLHTAATEHGDLTVTGECVAR